jgi:drug/metabolite transporter (DMT)-like permease
MSTATETITAPRRDGAGVLAIGAAAILWSTGGVVIKLTPLSAASIVAGRALVAALFFLFVLRTSLRRARWDTALVYAGTMMTFIVATKLTTAANAVFLQYSGSAYVLVLGPLVLRERMRPADVVCALVTLGGVAIVLLGGGAASPGARPIAGNLVAAASGVFFALTLLFMRRDARAGGGLASTALGNVLAAVLAAPFAFLSTSAPTPSFGALAALVYLGAVGVGVSYALFTRGLRTTPAAKAGVLAALEPVLSPVWVALGTGERPSTTALVGGAIVVSAIVTSTVIGARA